MNRLIFLKKLSVGFLSLFIPKAGKKEDKKRKYFLTKFYVAGFNYYEGETVIDKLNLNDEIKIIPEPTNEYDKRALELFTANNIKLGYVPRDQNPIPSRLLRQKLNLVGTVDKINLEADPWRMLRVSLFVEV